MDFDKVSWIVFPLMMFTLMPVLWANDCIQEGNILMGKIFLTFGKVMVGIDLLFTIFLSILLWQAG